MERDEITPPNDQQERGAGGKVRKPPPRKPAPSPYARPAESQRRWISKLVDPACRLIAGGAIRIFPSFFSKPASTCTLTSPSCDTEDDEDRGNSQTGEEGDKDDDRKCNFPAIKSTEIGSTSDVTDELKGKSDLDLHRPKGKEKSENSKLSEIEQLVKGKRFSRDEVNCLMGILNSKVTDLPNTELQKENAILTARKDDKGLLVEHGFQKVPNEQTHGELKGAIWGSSTPVGSSKVQEEIGASPIDIARAYMDSRASEAGPSSKSIIPIGESTVLPGTEAAIKLYVPLASPNSSTCWPGAVVHNTYSTPQSQRSGYGLYDFPRTPYSRTILSKSKSRSIYKQSDHNRISSSPLHQLQTPLYGQDKSRGDVLEGGYGSVGPIRRVRHKVFAQSSRKSTNFNSSLDGPSQRESSDVLEGFLPTKSLKTFGTSSSSKFHSSDNKSQGSEIGVPTVHMHTSLMARKILEHIDRNPPTPKQKSAELKLTTKWKNPESSVDVSTILSNENNSVLKIKDVGPYKYNGLDGKNSTPKNEGLEKSNVDVLPKLPDKSVNARNEGSVTSDMNVGRSILVLGNDARTSPNSVNFSRKYSEEDALKTIPSGSHCSGLILEKKPVLDASLCKPVLPSISIYKPDSRWPFALDNNSGFTFPVSASSSVLSEPPTPSILPSFSAGGQNQSKERCVEPSYSFGLKRSSPVLVFSFPSTSSTAVHNDAGDIKFNFGSNEKARLSFGSFGKNAIAIK